MIEDHDAGERAARCRAPVAEGAGERGGDVVAEALADLRIELIVLAEPRVANGMRRGAEPEVEHFACTRRQDRRGLHAAV